MDLLTIRSSLSEGKTIYDLPLKVTYYARVSTDKDEQRGSLDNQVTYYEQKIKGQPSWTYVPGYVDEGISGKSAENRGCFMRMIRDAKAGAFDFILTKEISRFSRNTLDSIKYTQQLYAKGVGVFFESDNINTLDSDSELRLTIMASLAQDEVRKLSERLRFGYKRSIEKGRVLGQNNMLGYEKKDGALTIVEEEAVIVRRIFEVYTSGIMGVRGIANLLEREGLLNPKTGLPVSHAAVPYILRNPKYKGYYCARKTISVDYRNSAHVRQDEDKWLVYKDERIPAIVPEEMWDYANRLYRERGTRAKENAQAASNRYAFSGRLICGEHGASYHRHVYKSKKHGEQEVWNCRLYRLKGRDAGCDSPTIYTSELNEILYGVYQTVYRERDAVINGLMELYGGIGEKDYAKASESAQKAIAAVRAKKDKLLELVIEGIISKDELKERNDRFNEEIKSHTAALESAQKAQANALDRKRNLSSIRKALEAAADDPETYVASLSGTLLDRIVVHKTPGEKSRVKLEIILNVGKAFEAVLDKHVCISLQEIGISQAQVSRLEKTALSHMRKFV